MGRRGKGSVFVLNVGRKHLIREGFRVPRSIVRNVTNPCYENKKEVMFKEMAKWS